MAAFESWVLDSKLKKLDFPTLGTPTIPIFKLLPGRPKRIFFSGSTFFPLGANGESISKGPGRRSKEIDAYIRIFFLANWVKLVEKVR